MRHRGTPVGVASAAGARCEPVWTRRRISDDRRRVCVHQGGSGCASASLAEAKLRRTNLVVINSNRGGRDFDGDASARSESELERIATDAAADGVDMEVRQPCEGTSPQRT